jgi:folate-binding protein YgfZ
VHLAVEDGAAGDVLALLERQRIFDDVIIGDHRNVLRTITVQGPHALAVAQEAFGAGGPPGTFAAASVADAAVLVVPSRRSRPGGVDVFALSKHVNLVREALTASGARWFDERIDAALEASRIEAGIARAGTEAGPGVLPQEANLTDYLSTTKGCYVGQEIMARLEARATVKRRLVQLRFAERARDALAPGTPVEYAGRTVGRLGATAMHPMLGFVGLAVLHRAHSDTIDVAGHQAAIVQV